MPASPAKRGEQSAKLNNLKEIAEVIIKKWQEIGLPDFVEKVEVAGPGFINIWLKSESLVSHLVDLLNRGFTHEPVPPKGGAVQGFALRNPAWADAPSVSSGSASLKESQGAKVIEVEGDSTPAMLVKSDGGTTYLLRDLATVKFRMKTWQPDLIIYEVGADQSFHFRQLFKLCALFGYGQLNMFVHVPHGLIRWKSGKFSTRKGMTIHLEEVLSEAIERAGKLCETAGVAKDLSEKEKEKAAKAVGIGAIKYNDLKQNPTTDIIFDWDQMLTLSGNSGPYLQYTFARTQSVLRKTKDLNFQFSISNFQSNHNFRFLKLSEEEKSLLRVIYRFSEAVGEAAKTFSPNLICNFLFDLAQKFNLFYDKHRILAQKSKVPPAPRLRRAGKSQNYHRKCGIPLWRDNLEVKSDGEPTEEQSQFRLLLTASVGQVLKNGLNLLGIEALEKM